MNERDKDKDKDLRNIKRKRDSSDKMAVLRFTNLAWNWSAEGSRMNKSVNKVIEYFKNRNLSGRGKKERTKQWNVFLSSKIPQKSRISSGKVAITLISEMNKYSNYFVQVSLLKLSALDKMVRLPIPVKLYNNYTIAVEKTFQVHSFLFSLYYYIHKL